MAKAIKENDKDGCLARLDNDKTTALNGMSTETFYSKLPALDHFSGIANSDNFVAVPDDWHIIITDITKSTEAIELGRYRDVNLLGASSIIATLNVAKAIDIPFVFGGDGASILIPPSLVSNAKQALLGLRRLAKGQFGLDLRVGIVPVAMVTKARQDVKVAKFKMSEHYTQAAFAGGGLTYATELIKNSNTMRIDNSSSLDEAQEADLSGLACRWQDIPSRHGEVVSLLVLATSQTRARTDEVYQDVMQQIQMIYGDEKTHHPVTGSNLNLTFEDKSLMKETKLRARSSSWFHQQLYLWQIKLENLLGLMLMQFKSKVGAMDWGLYKDIVTNATDYKKFDDMLRMVISGDAAQRETLTRYLESKFKDGSLVYGTQVSDRAIMTCLVFEHNGPQVHFIDGANGGYALAAKSMKARLSRKAQNWNTYMTLIKQRGALPS